MLQLGCNDMPYLWHFPSPAIADLLATCHTPTYGHNIYRQAGSLFLDSLR